MSRQRQLEELISRPRVTHSLENMILQNHIPRNPKGNPLPLLLTGQLGPHPRPPLLDILTPKRSSRKNRLPPVLAGTLHILFPLDWGDTLHPRLSSTPDGLVEREEEGVVVLSRFSLSWEESIEEGEEVGFACACRTGDEDSLESEFTHACQRKVGILNLQHLHTFGTSNSASSSSPLKTRTKALSLSSLVSG